MIAEAMTITVHLVELTVARRSEVQDGPGLPFVFAFEWPSLLLAVELLSWHLFFGLACCSQPRPSRVWEQKLSCVPA